MDLDIRNAYKILIRKTENENLRDLGLKIGVMLKWFITK